MADISPVRSIVDGVPTLRWDDVSTSTDTPLKFAITEQWGLAGCVQATGTFGGASVALVMSNDGTNWASVKDLQGATIALTDATSISEFTCSAAYIKPAVTGGTGDNIDIIVVLRGLY
jgi:hypothetical protein